MRKRGKHLFIYNTAIFEILLLVSFSFAVAFILGDNFVSGQGAQDILREDIERTLEAVEASRGVPPSPSVPGPGARSWPQVTPRTYGPPIPKNLINTASPGSFDVPTAPTTIPSKSDLGDIGAAELVGDVRPEGVSPIAPTYNDPYKGLSFWDSTKTDITIGGKNVPAYKTNFEGADFALVDNKVYELVNGEWIEVGEHYYQQGPMGLFGTSNFFLGNLLQGVMWSLTAVTVIQLFGLFGLDQDLSNTLSASVAAGIMGGKIVHGAFGATIPGKLGSGGFITQTLSPFASGIIGVGIGAAVFIAMYKKEKMKIVRFQCLPFEPPLGGQNCEKCNDDKFRPCSEYRCRSLGQACELLNEGTGEEACTWVSRDDTLSPVITAWTEALKPKDLSYKPDNAIRPPNRGTKIVSKSKDSCIKAFTPFEFGIETNEPAQCKINYLRTESFDDMEFFFGGSNYYRYNHSQKMKLPGPDSGEEGDLAPELENDGTFSLFTRCRDANGNENVDEFVFNFCVDPSPDTTPPLIDGLSIISGSPVRFDVEEVPIEVYVNEPAECKWSRKSKSFEEMENKMDCATETFQVNAELNYVCKADLTGIKNNIENNFFFKCKDKPGKPDNERNVMVQSEPLVLRGSQPLNILNVGPNGTIFGSTEVVTVDLTVRTDDGSDEGVAICYLSSTGEANNFIKMSDTNSFNHKQSLDLTPGAYEFFFRCIDRGGNLDTESVSFNIFVDKQKPLVTRVYREDGLKVVTDEDSVCVYDLKSCNYVFEEGLAMIYSNPNQRQNSFAEWKANSVYYVKCKDVYDNKPGPNDCSIIVNAIELGGD